MERKVEIKRITKETEILLRINYDGSGNNKISTGIGFFDHMLQQISVHGKFDIDIEAKGDLFVDDHHTIEDVGIVLGQSLIKAIGDKKGINRYGYFILPMDDALILESIDICGRPYLNFDVKFIQSSIGTLNTQMIIEFFKAFVNTSGVTLHITKLYGYNDHHVCEAIFKAFAKVLNIATRVTSNDIPSSKGVL
ncbi:imidazoleglycerol-phosphate dehydratase HisB [Caldicellulosiruptoraceae bacterium PP1]